MQLNKNNTATLTACLPPALQMFAVMVKKITLNRYIDCVSVSCSWLRCCLNCRMYSLLKKEHEIFTQTAFLCCAYVCNSLLLQQTKCFVVQQVNHVYCTTCPSLQTTPGKDVRSSTRRGRGSGNIKKIYIEHPVHAQALSDLQLSGRTVQEKSDRQPLRSIYRVTTKSHIPGESH